MRNVFRAGRYASVVFVAVLLAVVSPVRGETHVGGVILSDTTWDLAGSPYVVAVAAGDTIIVGGDATLTIEPGVEVRFEAGLGLLIGRSGEGPGTLVARGTEEEPIVFTSIKDPNDPDDPAIPGDWNRIDFLDLAADATFDVNDDYQSGCILEHVIVEYAGSDDYGAVHIEQSAPFLKHSDVRENLKGGIGASSAPPLRIENCYVHDNHGGGISFGSTLGSTLTGNTISGNITGSAGGIYFYFSGGNTLTGNTITGNRASSAGGGIYFFCSDGNTLTSNTISGNRAFNNGGGIYFYDSGSNTLTDNTISGNIADDGAGIQFRFSDSNVLTGNTVSGNTADGEGGGISFDYYSHSNTFTGNTISGNSAGAEGGGILFDHSNGNTLTGNTISGNSADDEGGGIYFHSSGANTLTDNNIEDNTAGNEGGALYVQGSGSSAYAGNTIRFNHTTGGQTGGIFVTDRSRWLSLDGGTGAYNTICCNDGYEVYNNNTLSNDGRRDVDARNVLWCTDDTGVIQSEIYDFSDDGSRAMVLWDSYIWPLPCDLDGDGDVDLADLADFLGAYGTCDGDEDYRADADFDDSGCIELADLAVLLGHYGEGC